MTDEIVITIWHEGGVIHAVDDIPPGVTLRFLDYDTEGADEEGLIEVDGAEYYEITYTTKEG